MADWLPVGWVGGFDAATENNIDASLGKCSTWDVLLLEGGKQLTGDFRSGPTVSRQRNVFLQDLFWAFEIPLKIGSSIRTTNTELS